MEAISKDTWIFIETKADGSPRNVGLELLNPGRRLADEQGGKLVGVVIAAETSEAVQAAANYGVDMVLAVEGAEYRDYSAEAHTAAFAYLIEKHRPLTVMIGATTNGRDLAPRISGRVQTGLTADCTQLEIDESTGCVAWTRPTFSGNLMAVIFCAGHRPQMGTVRPGVFKKPEFVRRDANVVMEDFRFDPSGIRARIVEVLDEAGEQVDLEGAEIIVTGGRGVGGAQGFEAIRRLAGTLGGTVGASRAAVEQGWIPHAHQVGQTGKTVAPKVYIACGISGASQHIAGMSASETIIAVNKDPNAAIFGVADYGIVGDLFEVIPVLEAELKSRLA
ncbi:MAG: electron transfer flavoprotein subunit alpha/FixB family protein [Defluviitaleaceae bacterium]|nr:electron transfer flavoprotein subunit alpha/FixB family protein [Defluviitaleaceae bacterium]